MELKIKMNKHFGQFHFEIILNSIEFSAPNFESLKELKKNSKKFKKKNGGFWFDFSPSFFFFSIFFFFFFFLKMQSIINYNVVPKELNDFSDFE